jgi:ribosomal protein S12 methylthiotransferase accessory factor
MYGRSDDPDTLRRWRDVVGSTVSARRFGDVPDQKSDSPNGDVKYELSRLRSAGIDQVIVVDLSPGAHVPFSVVRVIVPRLEGPQHWGYVPGPRATVLRGQLP